MSIRLYGDKWLISGGNLATDDDCCCEIPCLDCYRIDYQWAMSSAACHGTPKTFSGSVLIRSDGAESGGEIVYYSDPDVVSVEIGLFSGGKMMALDYGDACGWGGPASQTATLTFVCLLPSHPNPEGGGGVIVDNGNLVVDSFPFPDFLCCGGSMGSYSFVSVGSPPEHTLTVTISRVGVGVCDGAGFTPVPP